MTTTRIPVPFNAGLHLHDLVCSCGSFPHCGALDNAEVQERFVADGDGYVDTSCGKDIRGCDCDDIPDLYAAQTIFDLSKISRAEKYELASKIISDIDEEWAEAGDAEKWQEEN